MSEQLEKLRAAIADRYAVERELGQGGMATVFLANDIRHGREVAVKVLRAELAATLGPDRFLREIQIAARLQHPHIVPLYDSGEAAGLLYYVMPYLEGEPLRTRLTRERELPIAESVRILRDVADALSYAHGRDVVHRDIKPDNVMISGRHAMVTDFGVAKAVSEATGRHTLTTAGVALGTPSYMAPEQAVADPQVDHRADLYALGALAYELLTGQPPFVGTTPQQVLAAHVTEGPRPVTDHRPAVPAPLGALVMQCLEKKPADRPQTAGQVLQQLESLGTPSGGTTPTDTRPVRVGVRPWAKRLRYAGAAAVFVLVAGLAVSMLVSDPPAATLGQLTHLTSAPGLEMDPAISPDGNMVAYAAGPPGGMKIYVRQVSGGRTIALSEELPGHHRWPQWSPDGSRIAFQAGGRYHEAAGAFGAIGGAIYVVPALGGQPRRLVEPESGVSLFGPAWSPAGDEIAYVRDDRVVVQSVSGGAATPFSPGDSALRSPHSIAWSPDASRVAVVSGNQLFTFGTAHLANAAPSGIWILARGGNAVPVTQNNALNMSPVWSTDGASLLFVSSQDGARDLYQVNVTRAGRVRGPPTRLSTGLNPHTISITRDGARLAMSVYSMNAHIWSLPVPAQESVSTAAARALTAGTEAIESVALSFDGRWIAYDSDRSGNQDIWKIAVSGGEPIKLTTHPADDFVQSWSQDGRTMSLHSFRNGNRDVFVMSAEGGSIEQVTSEPSQDLNPFLSPDGNCVAFQSDRSGRMEIHVACRAGPGAQWEAARQLTTAGGVDAQWSPDGRWIAYIQSDELRVVSPDGGPHRVVIGADAPQAPAYAVWSRDARTLYYKGYDDERRSRIWSVPFAGGAPRLLVRFDDENRPSFRREFDTDDRRFVFTIGRHESDVWAVELEWQ